MKKALFIFLVTALSGCAHSPSSSSPGGSVVDQAQINHDVQIQLQQAADSTQSSLKELASIEKNQFQNKLSIPLSDVNDPALNIGIAIKWYGPIEPLLAQVAATSGYQLQVFGKPPSLPVLINIDTLSHAQAAITIIRNADLQAGLKVAILIFPAQKIISLRYAAS